ncbi:MAG: hypothetical protein HS108_03910 [Planctomycetes bacterium]|nr:hypothetical protein [Planctomycetota bacterium]MCL4731136.1 hypothetical protein [Planctomycetota bacterium]
MPVTNADLLADDLLALSLVENSPVKIPFFQAWIWQEVAGKSLTYARTPLLAPATEITACANVPEQEAAVSQAGFEFVDFATRYAICASDLDRFRHPQLLQSVFYAIAKRRILYAYAARLGAATGNPAQGGLRDLADPARVINLAGGALTLPCLDEAYERVTAGTGRPTLIMSHSRSLRTYRNLCRVAGFKPERVPFRWYNPAIGGMQEGSVDALNGTPWLANDMLGSTPERTYFMVVGDDGNAGPTRGVTGIVPAHLGRNMFIKRTVPAIISVEAAESQPGEETWVTMPAGLALGSQGALSIIENYTIIGPCVPDPA